MKIKKIILSSVLLLLSLTNICNAYTISMNDVKAKKGEEFTFTINVDEETYLAKGHIKFDSSKLEYVGCDQENMTENLYGDGDVAWMYIDISGAGTKSFEFKFKVKESGKSQMTLEDLAFVDVNGTKYEQEQISGNTSIYVNKSNVGIIIIILAIILAVLVAIRTVKKKNNKKESKR